MCGTANTMVLVVGSVHTCCSAGKGLGVITLQTNDILVLKPAEYFWETSLQAKWPFLVIKATLNFCPITTHFLKACSLDGLFGQL